MPSVAPIWFIDWQLQVMSSYLDVLGSALEAHAAEFAGRLEAVPENLPSNERLPLVVPIYEQLGKFEQEFPRLLRTSFLLSWYSYLEHSLLGLCDQLRLRVQTAPLDPPFAEKGIFRARRFLKEAAQYEIPPGHWQELTFANRIRNILVHHNATILAVGHDPNHKNPNIQHVFIHKGAPVCVELPNDLFRYLQSHSILAYIGPHFVLDPPVAYCRHVLHFTHDLLEPLYRDVKPRPEGYVRQ